MALLVIGEALELTTNRTASTMGTIEKKRKIPPQTLGASLGELNGAVFAVAMPSRIEHVKKFLMLLNVPPKRRIIVQSVDASTLGYSNVTALIADGVLSAEWWATKKSQTLRVKSNGTRVFSASYSRVAVSLSHLKAQQKFLASTYDIGLFIEDDVSLEPEFKTRMGRRIVHSAIANAPTGWQMLWLGYCYETCEKGVRVKPNEVSYKRSIKPRCLHGFLATRKASSELITKSLPLRQAIDDAFGDAAAGLMSYVTVPRILTQAREEMGSLNHDPGRRDFARGYDKHRDREAPEAFKSPRGSPSNGGSTKDCLI